MENKEIKETKGNAECKDNRCPRHGSISLRGRTFECHVVKIVGNRAKVERERIIYVPKYERYAKRKSKFHAHIPACMADNVKVGSYVKIQECRPLSKIMHFIIIEVIK